MVSPAKVVIREVANGPDKVIAIVTTRARRVVERGDLVAGNLVLTKAAVGGMISVAGRQLFHRRPRGPRGLILTRHLQH
jgi:hypothetical protein